MALTPMMQQYLEVKEKYNDCILFFRLGDFYEMFFEDAEKASRELELVLTGRDCGLAERAPMCGIPFHAANTYISRLVHRGYKIAICEQMEDPAIAKGIVKRDVIKIVTPGTYMDPNFLEEHKNNYLVSLYITNDSFVGLSIADISTGELNTTSFRFNESFIIDEISKYNPKEIILQNKMVEERLHFLRERFPVTYTTLQENKFTEDARKHLMKQFPSFEEGHLDEASICATNGLLLYINDTQKIDLSNLNQIEYYSVLDYLSIDINSRRNLELTETLRDQSKKGTLLWVLDKTSTAMGARQLRRWIERPLVDARAIQERLDSVEEILANIPLHEDLKESLKAIYDIERIAGKIASKGVNARELLSLKNSIGKLPAVKKILEGYRCGLLSRICAELDLLEDIFILLDASISETPAVSIKEGSIIKQGFHAEVDQLREAKSHGKEWIANLESNEREATGIKSLKVGYNKVFGYYIEITKSNLNAVPEDRFIRKQTLANAERYITPELKEMEDKILGAEDRLVNLEYELFVEVREKAEAELERIMKSARLIAELDCLSSLAATALENNYCKPNINKQGLITIEEGRHPVVEKVISTGGFIANDTLLDQKKNQLLLITGPNMAGKSTYMRQVALIVVMAQLGSFVPASAADISIVDKIFTRIGASDDLSSGKSTFMVEMTEVSHILKNATKNSLIILDEVGRGTSTYDGLSIAWAVIEYICKKPHLKSKTLFATHYHELTKLEETIEGVMNYSVAVKEIGNDIVFMHKIISGGADQSYGIEVAKLAGLPDELLQKAKELLKVLEQKSEKEPLQITAPPKNKNKGRDLQEAAVTKLEELHQLDFTDLERQSLIRELASLDVVNMTPMEGLNTLYNLTKKAKTL